MFTALLVTVKRVLWVIHGSGCKFQRILVSSNAPIAIVDIFTSLKWNKTLDIQSHANTLSNQELEQCLNSQYDFILFGEF